MTTNSPRVNSGRLSDYVNRTVRLTGKVLRFNEASDEVVLQASDKGEVKVILLPGEKGVIDTAYVEIIGVVQNQSTIKAQACINLGPSLDLELVNFVVEKWHDPRFSSMF
ncbi:replication factor A protein 3 [Trametopsis cervina]|nr:replication factor A protein 3 [Trametopsis cervina]